MRATFTALDRSGRESSGRASKIEREVPEGH